MRQRPNWSTQGLDCLRDDVRSSWVEFFFGGGWEWCVDRLLKWVHILFYYYAALFLYTIILYLYLIIYIWFISPSLICFFFHQSRFLCTGSMKVLRPSRQVGHHFTGLSRWSNKPWHKPPWKEEAARREAFFGGMWYGSTQCSNWYMIYDFLKW